MTTKELYTKGARVWVEHPERVWEGATVTADYRTGVVVVQIDATAEIRQIKIKEESQMPPLQNPSLLIGQNDLTSLSYLHEPAVLHNLRVRFCDRNAIYTYCGIVLVAINPYYELPIYGDETIVAYRGQAMGDLDPHIFAVAEEAYTKLERENRDQSIIVSGESGAGKTVSAKYAMRYMAAVGGSASETHVERKVLASSPIMEALGNAKTTRNDNSSRFGKFIEVHFDRARRICGASVRTYLLERSRVVHQGPAERNYHVFYQVCAAARAGMLPELCPPEAPRDFHYLSRGGCSRIEGVDDLRAFSETRAALGTLGVGDEEQRELWAVLGAVLHLGDVRLDAPLGDADADEDAGDGDAAHVSPDDEHLAALCRLVGVARGPLARWLVHRRIASAHEVIEARMDRARAMQARDALAKRLYGELFAWLVRAINRALDTSLADKKSFIGVLDIYGFETFETNSFEQFCINYANEKLQQQFNWHVFKLEQEEYVREGISWEMISFEDNQPCIELMEERLGVLALLDEECRVPQGSDRGFVDKLRANCAKYKHYANPRFGSNAFIIRHFADAVEYQAEGFVEKNRDTVSEEQLECIRGGSSLRLVREMLAEGAAGGMTSSATLPARRKTTPGVSLASLTQPPRRSASRATVGSQFRQSLAALMATLSATTPHYVRCIKPNDTKQPFQFDAARAVHQLRACGVLETIRISAAGFPSRWLYQDFFQRYRLLCPSGEVNRADPRGSSERILRRHVTDATKYQFGATKMFFRAGQVAYLEGVRGRVQRACCVRVQAQVRGFLQRRLYALLRRTALGLQARARGLAARRRAHALRQARAARVLQAHVRGWLARRRYLRLRGLAVALQARARGLLARRLYTDKRRLLAVVTLQRYCRGWLARRAAAARRRRIVIAQAAVRRFLARRQYKRLRIEARSLDHVKSLNKGLENKIISLQQRLGDALARAKLVDALQLQLADYKGRVEGMRALEAEARSLRARVSERDGALEAARAELQRERDERAAEVARAARESETARGEADALRAARALLERELQDAKVHADTLVQEQRESAAREAAALRGALEAERAARQKLLADNCELHGQLDSLRAPQASDDAATEDDFGYGSVRSASTVSSRGALEAVNWAASGGDGTAGGGEGAAPADAGLVLRLHARLATLQTQHAAALRRVEDLERRLAERTGRGVGGAGDERFRVEELEIENKKLRESIASLSAAAARGGDAAQREAADQLGELQQELDRRRDECIQLKSVLSHQRPWFQALKNVTVNLKSLASSNYGSDVDIMNEDGELASAYEAQKGINKQLQEELVSEKQFYEEQLRTARAELDLLRDQSEGYQKLLSMELVNEGSVEGVEGRGSRFAQGEISRLVAENLALQERVDKLSGSCRQYKHQIQRLADRLKESGVDDVSYILDNNESAVSQTSSLAPVTGVTGVQGVTGVTRKKEREYLGMFEYKAADEALIIKKLIIELKPRVAVTLLPGLPAYILFMMLRHMDHVDDEPKMHRLMRAVRAGVKKTLKRRGDSVEAGALWLSNLLRLLNALRQYSGDERYAAACSARQRQQALRVFDLSEYRQVLSDTAVWIYQTLVAALERALERLIVPAVLEHEEVAGLSAARAGPGPARLKRELLTALGALAAHALDPPLQAALFKQLFYYICAYSLNQLLLRKDLCCWAKGLQIRYNVSHLENWIKEHLAEHGQKTVEEVLGVLRPITQAVQLLQARKSMADVQSTVDMCADLNAMQVSKILNMYTPAEEYEVKVTREFIHEIQKKMQERAGPLADKEPQNLLMDSKMIFSVQFPYCPSPIRLEDIELPEVLGLQGLLTKI